jgi:outer membrane protein assembly factor BamB
MLSAKDGQRLWELQIGENINATPAILDGRIYIGAFNGKLYGLGPKEMGKGEGGKGKRDG